jgi:hypothetical protein
VCGVPQPDDLHAPCGLPAEPSWLCDLPIHRRGTGRFCLGWLLVGFSHLLKLSVWRVTGTHGDKLTSARLWDIATQTFNSL